MLRRDFLFGVAGSAAAVPACLTGELPNVKTDSDSDGDAIAGIEFAEQVDRGVVIWVIPPVGWTPSGLCDIPPGESVLTGVSHCDPSDVRRLVRFLNRRCRDKHGCRHWYVDARRIGQPYQPRPAVTFTRKQRAWVAVATCMTNGVDGVGPLSRLLKIDRVDVWVARRKFRLLGLTADDFRSLRQRVPEDEFCREVVVLVLDTQRAQRREQKRRSKLARIATANAGII